MDSLIGLFRIARLYDQVFGKFDDVLCVECKTNYRKWVEYCEKCGSDHVIFIDPRENDAQHFLNLGEHLKEIVIKNALNGVTAEAVRDKLNLEGFEKKQVERIYRGQKFAVLLVNKAKEQQSPIEYVRKGDIKKKCPHCAELILYEAKVCKHCGRDLIMNSSSG